MDDLNENPFADPNNQFNRNTPLNKAQNDKTTVQYGALDAYNPFDDQNTEKGAKPSPVAVLPSEPEQPPPYSSSGAQRITTAELERRQRELEERTAELNRREEEHRRRMQEVAGGERANNWPPLPNCFPCKPCFYQDFDIDIPAEHRRLVRLGYYLWIGHAVVMVINVIGTLCYFIGSSFKSESASTFGMSIVLLVIFTPLSFVCWYRPLYKAFKSDSSFNFFLFFIVMGVQCLIILIQCLGINWFSSCGYINAASMIKDAPGVAIFMFIIAVLFTILFACDVLILIRVHRLYRSTGASLEKARAEFSSGVVNDPTVRSMGSSAVSGAAHSAMAGNNSGSSYRY